jgi:hypothetical protein
MRVTVQLRSGAQAIQMDRFFYGYKLLISVKPFFVLIANLQAAKNQTDDQGRTSIKHLRVINMPAQHPIVK